METKLRLKQLDLSKYSNTTSESIDIIAKRSAGSFEIPAAVIDDTVMLKSGVTGHDGTSFYSDLLAGFKYVAEDTFNSATTRRTRMEVVGLGATNSLTPETIAYFEYGALGIGQRADASARLFLKARTNDGTTSYIIGSDSDGVVNFSINSDGVLSCSSIDVAGFSANRIVVTDSLGNLAANTFAATILGTTNEITVTDNANGTATISLPSVVYLGTAGKIGRDADNLLDFSVDNAITVRVNALNQFKFDSTGKILTNSIGEYTASNGITVANDTTFSTSVVVTGNLTVNGTFIKQNVSTVDVEDNLMYINTGETGAGVTAGYAGMRVDRGAATDYSFFFREDNDTFRVGVTDFENNTAQGGAAATITLAASTDHADLTFYNSKVVKITEGTGAGQFRSVAAAGNNWNNTTKVLTVSSVWATNPDATSKYEILISDTTQAVATRLDTMIDKGIAYWDNTTYQLKNSSAIKFDDSTNQLQLNHTVTAYTTDNFIASEIGVNNDIGWRLLVTSNSNEFGSLTIDSYSANTSQFKFNSQTGAATYQGLIFRGGLTYTKLLSFTNDGSGTSGYLSSANINSYISGTVNQITVSDDGDGTITLSTPQNIDTAANIQFGNLGIGVAAPTSGNKVLIGSTANTTDFNTGLFSSRGDSGASQGGYGYGVVGESITGAFGAPAVGVLGIGYTSDGNPAYGVYGLGKALSAASATTYGGYFISGDSHTGGDNVGIYASATSSSTFNYAIRANTGSANAFTFYGTGGTLYNSGYINIGASAVYQINGVTVVNQGVTSVDSPTFTGLTLSGLTASQAVFTDASNGLVSNAITGTGSVAMSTSPTITSPTINTSITTNYLTAGSVLFAGASKEISQDNANLFWDNTNKYLGIGTNSPEYILQVAKSSNISGSSGNAWIRLINTNTTVGDGITTWNKAGITIACQNSATRLDVFTNNDTTYGQYGCIQTTGNYPLLFGVNSSGTVNEKLRITSLGTLISNTANLAMYDTNTGSNIIGYIGLKSASSTGGSDYGVATFSTSAFSGVGMYGKNSANKDIFCSDICGALTNTTAGSEDSCLGFRVMTAGGRRAEKMRLQGNTFMINRTDSAVYDTNAGANVAQFYPFEAVSFNSTAYLMGYGASTSNCSINFARLNTDSKYVFFAGIRGVGTSNAAGGETGDLLFLTQAGGAVIAERMRINSSGETILGNTAPISFYSSTACGLSVQNSNAAIQQIRFSNSANGAVLCIAHSRSDTIGTMTALSNNDNIGAVDFMSWYSDTSTLRPSARIMAFASENHTATSVGGYLSFWTNGGSSANSLERMRISSTGQVLINPSTVTLRQANNGTDLGQYYELKAVSFNNTAFCSAIGGSSSNTAFTGFIKNTNATPQYVEVASIQTTGTNTAGSETGNLTFHTRPSTGNMVERMRITSAGNVGIGTTTPKDALHISKSGYGRICSTRSMYLQMNAYDDSGTWKRIATTYTPGLLEIIETSDLAYFTSSAGATDSTITWTERFRVRSAGELTVPDVYTSTTAASANVYVASGGRLTRATSSIRYKKDIEDMQDIYSENIYNMRPVWYRSKCEIDNPNWGYWGLIAEELAEIDPRLVHWGYDDEDYNIVEKDGMQKKELKEEAQPKPNGVMYDRITVLLLKEIKKLKERIEVLENGIQSNGAGSHVL